MMCDCCQTDMNGAFCIACGNQATGAGRKPGLPIVSGPAQKAVAFTKKQAPKRRPKVETKSTAKKKGKKKK